MAKKKENIKKLNEKTLSEKWGDETISLGWSAIPNILIERQRALELSPIELNLILILSKYWWSTSKAPFPSKSTMADIINRDESTIRKTFASLEKRGLIERKARMIVRKDGTKGGRTSNEYHLDGLVNQLRKIALEEKKIKQEREEADAKRIRSKVA